MSRDWCAIYSAMLGKPKYRRLSVPARAALFHVWLLSGGQTPEATWTNRDELAEVLELDGFPPDVLEELVTRHWLDVDPAGRLLVHDWDDHQLAATVAARQAYERDRKQDWRRRHRVDDAPLPPDPSLPVPDITLQGTQQDRTVQESRPVPERPGHVRDTHDPKAGRTNGRDPLTCPPCGDLLEDTDPNVARDRHGQLWHRECPTAQASA
jgi:hypothetical protein